MEKLENHIRDKRQEFDQDEPSSGHLEKFQMKLAGYHSPKRIYFPWRPIMKVAAVILVLFTLTVTVNYFNLVPTNLFNNAAANELPAELKEVEVYYSSLNEEKLQQIEHLAGSKSEAEKIRKQAMSEVSELQHTTTQLQQEYSKEGRNERVFDAIVNNYRIISSLLDHIINDLSNEQEQLNPGIKPL
jgi:hypothetical protein